MILCIKDAETRTLAKQLAELTGISETDAVKDALRAKLEQVESFQGAAPNLDGLDRNDPQREELPRHESRSAARTAAEGRWRAAAQPAWEMAAATAEKPRAAAVWAAGNAPTGAARVRDGATDAAAWAAKKARDGVTTGLSVTQSHGAPVVTGMEAGVLAVSEKLLRAIRDPIPFWDAFGHLSRYEPYLDWTNVDPRKHLYEATRGTSRGMVIGFSVLGVRLAQVGKGWHQFFTNEQPPRPPARQCRLADHVRAAADYVSDPKGRRLAAEAALCEIWRLAITAASVVPVGQGLGNPWPRSSLWWSTEWRRRRESTEGLPGGRQDRRGGRSSHPALAVWWDKRNAKRTLSVCG